MKSLRTQLAGIHPEFAAGQIEVTFIFQQGISYEFEPRIAILRHLGPWALEDLEELFAHVSTSDPKQQLDPVSQKRPCSVENTGNKFRPEPD